MAIIYTYPIKTTSANRDDLILISDSADKNKTKQISVAKLPGGIDFVGVGGNGTAGKIPKWSTQYDLTDSSIFEDSVTGNIGIGQTNPNAQLDILDTASQTAIRVINDSYNNYLIQKTRSDNTQILGIQEFGSNGGLSLVTGGSQRLNIDNVGKVGIGTNVQNSILAVKAGADTAFITQTNTANSQKLQIGNAFSLYSGASGGHSAIASDTILAFATGNTESMRIIANGNVGIDNTAPSRKLTVGSGNQVIPASPLTISNGFQSNWVSKLYFGDPADWYKIAKLPPATNNGQRGGGILKFSLTGGNTAPTTYVINYFKYWTAFVGSNSHTLKLEQYGPNLAFTKARISLATDGEVYIEVYKNATIVFNSPPPVFHDSLLGYDGYQAEIIVSDSTNTLPSGSSGGSMEELSFVIHGTSVKRLLVNGTINLDNSGNLEMKAAANDAGDIIFKKSDNGQLGRIWSRNDGVEGGLYLATSGITPQLLITDAGDVGIGTTNPNDGDMTIGTPKLHVAVGGTSGTFNLAARFQSTTSDADNTGTSILINSSNDRGLLIKAGRKDGDREVAYFDVVTSIGNTTNMLTMGRFGNVYNVGIGTTTPDAKLEVIGETRISYAQSSQYKVRITNSDGNGRILVDGDTSSLIFGTSPSGTNATAIERMRITSAGDVGIGVTFPTSKLEVAGGDIEVDDSASGLILKSPDGTRYRVTVADGGTLSVAAV